MESLSNSLAHAITILFAQSASWSVEQQQAANSFILEANNRPESFPALLHILSEPSYSLVIKFFACNLLNEKVRKQWSHLQEHEQRRVADQLMHVLQSSLPALPNSSEATTYRSRVVLAFSSACVRLPDGLNLCHATVQHLFRASEPNSYCIALDLLSKINEEIDISDLQRSSKQDLQAACQQALPQHLAYVDQVLQSDCLQDSTLAASIVFLTSCCTTKMLTLRSFSSDYPRLFSKLLSCFAPPWRPPLFQQACITCRELAVIREYPLSQQGQQALDQLNQQLCAAVYHLLPVYLQDGFCTDSLLSCMVELCETLVVLLSAQQEELIQGRPQVVQVAAGLLKVIAQRPRSLAMLTFDLWAEMENFSEEERAQGVFNNLVVKDLLSVLLALVPWCPTQPVSRTFDEEEDRATFRDLRLGLDDVLGLCCEALPGHFFQSLASSVDRFCAQPQSYAHDLEACLFVLHACMGRIKAGHARDAQVVSFLLHTAHVSLSHVVSLQHAVGRDRARCSLSHFLGSLAFVPSLGGVRHESLALLGRSLPWLLHQVLDDVDQDGNEDDDDDDEGRSAAAQAAAQAFHRVVLGAGPLLYDPLAFPEDDGYAACPTALDGLLRYFTAHYPPRGETRGTCPARDVDGPLLAVEALVRAILACPDPSRVSAWLGQLARPVGQGLAVWLPREPSAPRSVHLARLLGYWTQMLRFCDAPVLRRGEPETHLLLPVLHDVWPLLVHVEASAGEDDAVVSRLWDGFARLVAALDVCVASLVPSLVSRLLAHVQRRGRIVAAPAVWACAMTVGDFLANHDPQGLADGRMRHLLCTLIEAVAQRTQAVAASPHLFVDVPDPVQTFGLDLDGIDAFARCLLAWLASPRIRPIFTPPAAPLAGRSSSGEAASRGEGAGPGGRALARVLLDTVLVFLRTSAEKDPLRTLHTVVSTLFSPSRFSLQFEDSAPQQHAVIHCLVPAVPAVLAVLLGEVSSPRLGALVITNVSEALAAVLAGLASEGWREGGEDCLVQALLREDVLAAAMATEMRRTLARAMTVLAACQPRRFKALLLDVYKVCCSEATLDVLVAYEDALL